MRIGPAKYLIATLFLSACGTVGPQEEPEDVVTIPEQVIQLAAPYQNVMSARLLPDDNCYWYEHDGVVETTLLPLRTINGSQICIQQEAQQENVPTPI